MSIASQPTTEQLIAEQYRQLFALPGFASASPGPATPAVALVRYQQAAERFGRLLAEVAIDAARRLGAALADDRPDAGPITTLRALHEIWIDCGEAAWASAAHREEFAAAQAELISALAALRAPAAPA